MGTREYSRGTALFTLTRVRIPLVRALVRPLNALTVHVFYVTHRHFNNAVLRNSTRPCSRLKLCDGFSSPSTCSPPGPLGPRISPPGLCVSVPYPHNVPMSPPRQTSSARSPLQQKVLPSPPRPHHPLPDLNALQNPQPSGFHCLCMLCLWLVVGSAPHCLCVPSACTSRCPSRRNC